MTWSIQGDENRTVQGRGGYGARQAVVRWALCCRVGRRGDRTPTGASRSPSAREECFIATSRTRASRSSPSSTYPTWETTPYRQLQFLLAIQIDGEAALFEHSAATLGWVDTCACIGSGSDIGQYIQATRFTADMDMRDGRRLAAHLLQQVKTYSPDCGGESTILLVPHQGETTFIEPRHILEDEQE